MGQISEANSGGVHWDWGQRLGQQMEPGRRGVERNKIGGLGPTEMIRKPPPSGGGGGVCWCSRGQLALQVLMGAYQMLRKNGKNLMNMDNQSWAGILSFLKISNSKT